MIESEIWETLKSALSGSLPLEMLPINIEPPPTQAPHQTPKRSVAERCATKEMDPDPRTRSRVLRPTSSSVATTKNVPHGHQPGKGARCCQAAKMAPAAVSTTATMYARSQERVRVPDIIRAGVGSRL